MLGIDQSYTRFGIAVAADGVLLNAESMAMSFKNKTVKRIAFRAMVEAWTQLYEPDIVVVERVRMFSQSFVSTATIIALGGLVAVAMDAVYPVPVFSVDTRNWKSKVLGTVKASKEDAVVFVKKLGFDVDHDAADAACMALSPWRGVNLKSEY